MGRHPRRNQAGEECVNPGIAFPVTSEAGVSRFPFARSRPPDSCPPQKPPHEPWGAWSSLQRGWDWSSRGKVTQVESLGKLHVLRVQWWDPGRLTEAPRDSLPFLQS